MVGDDERRAFVVVHLAAQAGEARFGAEEADRRSLAERHDEARLEELDLAVEIRSARRRFLGARRAIAGRAALHHVGDVRLAPTRDADRREHAVEELAGLAHEGLALLVLVGAGALSHEEPRRGFVAYAEHRLLALLAKGTRAAAPGRFLECLPIHERDARGGYIRDFLRPVPCVSHPVQSHDVRQLQLLQHALAHHSVSPRKSASSRPVTAG